jgi:bifunctional DNase/RNase
MNKPSRDELQVRIKALVPTPSGCGIFLTDDEQKVIAIFVDHSVAAAITMALHKIKQPRPMTHELIANIFAGLGVKVEKVIINDLQDDTYFARLFLVQLNELGRSVTEIDSRPSDAMAIALREECPIFVTRDVWGRAQDMSWALDQAQKKLQEDQDKDKDGPDDPQA